MIFSSPIFLFVFLPLTITIWFVSGRKKYVLLVASLIFYGWGEPRLILLLLFVIAFNFVIGNAIDKSPNKRLYFLLGVTIDLGVLIVFKYTHFLLSNINNFLTLVGWPQIALLTLPIPLPLGISFFTFQAIAYIFDIYHGTIAPAQTLARFALFKSFFPQLIAGPIVRYQNVSQDLAADNVSVDLFALGARRFIIGLAKKVVIADSLGSAVDAVFATPVNQLSLATAWLAALSFALQIYFDFSGYSDMAIGMGYLFGVRLPENFHYPYYAKSMQDFWRRWHITLSTWFRDYVYFPLGGNRRGAIRTYVNLILVFGLCGLWHGPTWSFLVWGLYNGVFLILERGVFGRILRDIPTVLQHVYLVVVVLVGWVFFRAPDLSYATTMIGMMFGSQGLATPGYPSSAYFSEFLYLIGALGMLCAMPWGTALVRHLSRRSDQWLFGFSEAVLMTGMLVVCGSFIAGQTHVAFIYFRF